METWGKVGGLTLVAAAAVATAAIIGASGRAPVRDKVAHKDLPAASPIASVREVVELEEGFEGPRLDASRWSPTASGDFEKQVLAISEGRLRLGCATRSTQDTTVKFIGVRSAAPVRLAPGTRLSFDLDWNRQRSEEHTSELQSQSNLVCR